MSAPAISSGPKAQLLTIRSKSLSARILLRSPEPIDVYSLTVRGRDPICTKYLPFLQRIRDKITIESNTRQVRNWRKSSGIDGFFLCVVLLSEHAEQLRGVDQSQNTNTTIGDTGLIPLDLEAKRSELGMMLNSTPDVRGKGYAVEALNMQFAYGFDHLGLEEIFFGTGEDNEPMRKLLEKKFGLEPQWREATKDYSYTATKKWWDERQAAAGEQRIVVEGELTDLKDEEKEQDD